MILILEHFIDDHREVELSIFTIYPLTRTLTKHDSAKVQQMPPLSPRILEQFLQSPLTDQGTCLYISWTKVIYQLDCLRTYASVRVFKLANEQFLGRGKANTNDQALPGLLTTITSNGQPVRAINKPEPLAPGVYWQ